MSPIANATLGLRRKSVLIVDDNAPVQGCSARNRRGRWFQRSSCLLPFTGREADRAPCFEIAIVDKRLVEQDSQNRDGLSGTSLHPRKGRGNCDDLSDRQG